jgi:hypothetical protein
MQQQLFRRLLLNVDWGLPNRAMSTTYSVLFLEFLLWYTNERYTVCLGTWRRDCTPSKTGICLLILLRK